MPRYKAKPRPKTSRGTVRTTRVRRRQSEFITAHGPCEQCGSTVGLTAFWRGDDRPLGNIQAYWLSGDEVREDLADKLIVLCTEHMRVHKGGAPHGGGVTGIKGCNCIPCVTKRREYVRKKHREHRGKGDG